MIAPATAVGGPPIPRTRGRAKRILSHYAKNGSMQISAGLVGVSEAWVWKWAKDDERFARRIDRALAVFLNGAATKLPGETNPVLAQSLRYILARRCKEYRQERGPVEKAVAEVIRRTVVFRRAKPPEKTRA